MFFVIKIHPSGIFLAFVLKSFCSQFSVERTEKHVFDEQTYQFEAKKLKLVKMLE